MTILDYESAVAGRFDALQARFRADLAADDFRLRALVGAIDPRPGLRVLDLGCGKGRFAGRLRSAGAEVVGMDRSAAMLAGGAGPSRVLGSAARLPFARASFDAVIAVEVLQHVAPAALGTVLDEAARVLKPGGRMAIIDRNAWAIDARRPWLPALAVKRLDEHRGRWMYPAGGPVRERWFRPKALRDGLSRRFARAEAEPLLAPDEAGRRVFRVLPWSRRMVLWTAVGPGGGGLA